jgi:hypothetical protein
MMMMMMMMMMSARESHITSTPMKDLLRRASTVMEPAVLRPGLTEHPSYPLFPRTSSQIDLAPATLILPPSRQSQ